MLHISNIKLFSISTLYWQMQMRLMEMKDLENHNDQSNWSSSPQSILVNGATDYCSLSTSSSETANLNEHTEGQNNLESEPIHQESSVSYSIVFIINPPTYRLMKIKICIYLCVYVEARGHLLKSVISQMLSTFFSSGISLRPEAH